MPANPYSSPNPAKTGLALLPGLANRHGLIAGATGTGKTVTLQTLAQRLFRDRRARVHGRRQRRPVRPVAGRQHVAQAEGAPWSARHQGLRLCRLSRDFLGRIRQARPPGARDGIRHGAAAAGAHAEPQRHAGGRARARLQDRRRQRPAAARHEGPARAAAARGRARRAISPPSTATYRRPRSAPSSAA